MTPSQVQVEAFRGTAGSHRLPSRLLPVSLGMKMKRHGAAMNPTQSLESNVLAKPGPNQLSHLWTHNPKTSVCY